MTFRRHSSRMRLRLCISAFTTIEQTTFVRFNSIIKTITHEGTIIADNEFDIELENVPQRGDRGWLVVMVTCGPRGTDLVWWDRGR
jgi:hypothetical protein